MPKSTDIQITTHGDPRTLPEYATLYQEVSKLSHPARPDPDWKQIETLCLSLFRRNGLDLQSAAWFTLSLAHQYGPDGLRDGFKVTEALISACWSSLWPRHPAERTEIVQTLIRRLQTLIRQWSSEDLSVLNSLYQCEKYLDLISGSLKQADLNPVPGPEALISLLRNITGRLEQMQKTATSASSARYEDKRPASGYPLVFIAPLEGASPTAVRPLQSFLAGMVVTLALLAIAGSGWFYATKTSESTRLLATVLHTPSLRLTADQLENIRRDPAVEASPWVNKIKNSTEALDAAGIGRTGSHSADLALLAATVWPLADATGRLLSEMIARRESVVAAPDRESAWQQGMDTLNALSEKLNALDEKRGRYLTVSELKTAIFSSRQAFSLHIPAEEWLRRYQLSPSSSEEARFRRAMDELQARYDLIRLRNTANQQQ